MRVSINKLTVIVVVLCFVFCSICFADMRVCVDKNTGKLIEMQSGGDDRPELMEMRLNTLKQNAINAGYKEDEIEVKWVADKEWLVMQEELNKPTPEQIADRETETLIQAKIKEQAITALKAEGKLDEDGKIVTKQR